MYQIKSTRGNLVRALRLAGVSTDRLEAMLSTLEGDVAAVYAARKLEIEVENL